ncbi:MAG: winged helix-turn-helix transcriptional regulator [Planctomycetes bacterium]|nr:winged helix-turn-helix transcriptional regulator [Planctomycetota bacterium]
MGTHFRGTAAQVRALDAYIKLQRAAESVGARVCAHLATDALTVGQFGVLEALLHLGPLCQRDLGAKLLRTGGNMTMVGDHLEARGLVARRRDARNRRFVTVALTAAGRRLIARVFPRHAAAIAHELAALRPQEQVALGRLCRRVGRGKPAE